MDKRDIFDVGSDIMEAVNDAVSHGDYSGLNETLRNVTGSAAGTAADALYNLQGRLQNGGSGAGGSGSGAAAQGGGSTGGSQHTYGHAGYASGNVTEEYMKRASGPAHHTRFSSKVSPFLQRQVSRNSGTGSIIGGIVSLVCAGFAFLDTVMTGLLGAFSPIGGGFFSASSLFLLFVTGALAILGGILVKKGQERKKLVREYYEYGRIAGTAEYLEIGKLARAVGESRETVLKNLEKMMSEELLPAAWFDRQKTTLMLTERMYNEYLQLERERQEQEAAAAMGRMKKDSSAADAAAAVEELPEDLRPRPEDAKLPPEARKIVEEGILYMGRIRAFNDDIGDEEVSAQLTQLETTMKRILDQIRKDPSSAPNLRRLMVYYLPTTMKLLQAYKELDSQSFQGENILSTRREIRDALGTINTAFENLLDSLFQDMAWDISSDISVMKTMMAQDGLTGDRIRNAAQGSARPSAQPAGQTAPSMDQGAGAAEGYTEGYTEGYSESMTGAGAAAAAQPAPPEEQYQGIRLTFGE